MKQKLKEQKGGIDKSTITVGDVWSAIKLQFFWLAISIYSIIKYFLIHYGHHGPELKNLTVKYQGLSVTIKIVWSTYFIILVSRHSYGFLYVRDQFNWTSCRMTRM